MTTPVAERATQPMTGVGTFSAVEFNTRSGACRHAFVKTIRRSGFVITMRRGAPMFEDIFNVATQIERRV